MSRILSAAAVAALMSAVCVGASHATTVMIWTDQSAAAGDATLANIAGLGAANATATVGAIDFTTGDSTSTSIDSWLGTSIGGTTGGHMLNNSVLEFMGTMHLNAGANTFNILHDDGVELHVDGIGTVLSDPGPTSAVSSPFTVNAPSAGTYTFELAYGECCGGPATVQFLVNGGDVGVPEPATWAMMILGVGLVGAAMRRRAMVVA